MSYGCYSVSSSVYMLGAKKESGCFELSGALPAEPIYILDHLITVSCTKFKGFCLQTVTMLFITPPGLCQCVNVQVNYQFFHRTNNLKFQFSGLSALLIPSKLHRDCLELRCTFMWWHRGGRDW